MVEQRLRVRGPRERTSERAHSHRQVSGVASGTGEQGRASRATVLAGAGQRRAWPRRAAGPLRASGKLTMSAASRAGERCRGGGQRGRAHGTGPGRSSQGGGKGSGELRERERGVSH